MLQRDRFDADEYCPPHGGPSPGHVVHRKGTSLSDAADDHRGRAEGGREAIDGGGDLRDHRNAVRNQSEYLSGIPGICIPGGRGAT